METNTIAKNLLLNQTCDTCRYRFSSGCVVDYLDRKSTPSENTCEIWKEHWMAGGWKQFELLQSD